MKLIRLLIYLLVLVLPLGQFSRISLPFLGAFHVNVYLNDLILPLLILAYLVRGIVFKRGLKLPPLTGLLFLFVAIAIVSLVNALKWLSVNQLLFGGLYLWRFLMYAGIYFVLAEVVDRGLVERLVLLLIFNTFFFSLAGLIQFLLFPDFSRYVSHGWDPHYYRVLSTFFDPNFAGIFLVLGLLLVLSLVLILKPNVLNKSPSSAGGSVSVKERSQFARLKTVGLWGSLSGLVILVILLTFSRSTYLSLLVGVGILGFLQSRKLLILMVVVSLLAMLFVPRVRLRVQGAFSLDITAQARIENWEKTIKLIRENFALGVGFNTLRYAQERAGYFRDHRGVNLPSGHSGAGADSSLLFVWVTTGFGGFLIYLSLLGRLWYLAWKNYQNTGGHIKALSLSLVAGLPALVLHAQFVNSLFYPWIMEWIWVVAGLSIVEVRNFKGDV